MNHCTQCGTAIPSDARFCPRCGTAVAASAATPTIPPPSPPSAQTEATAPARPVSPPPPAIPPQARPQRTGGAGGWWIAPAVVVGLVFLAWAVVSFMPFGGKEEVRPRQSAPTETIGEGTPATPQNPQASSTIVEGPGAATDTFVLPTTTTVEPPMTTPAPAPTATAGAQAPPVVVSQTQVPARPGPPPASRGEISASDAQAALQGYVRSTRYYGVANECVRVENRGYRNAGYNLEVWHSCPGSGGGARLLGRWRVDSKTREIFRQRGDGRYLRP